MHKALKSYPAILLFFLVYASLSLINLDSLPVAWTDEVLNLDPAVQYIQNGEYTSKLWPNPNCDILFASYLPAIQWFQTAYLTFLPIEIFWVRLPFALLIWGSLFLTYRFIRKNTPLNDLWSTVWVAIAFLDKSVFELSRSMRVEPLLIFGTLLLFSISPKRKLCAIKALIIGYLAMAHIYVWPFLFIWFITDWLRLNPQQKALQIFLTLAAPIAFLASVHFDISVITEQMGFHAQHHTLTQTDLPHNPIFNSLWYRFYPFYTEQPLNPIVFYALIIIILTLFIKQKMWRKPDSWIYGAWLLGIVLLFGVMTPQYRYLPIFWIIGILLVLSSKRIHVQTPFLKIASLLLAFNGFASFAGRHTAALLQTQARSPEGVHDFLRKNLKSDQNTTTLLLGESIGFYHAHRGRNHQRFDYGIDFYPQHFDWNNYDKVVLLTHDLRPQDSLIATYESLPEKWPTPKIMQAFAKGGTYNGMRLYLLKP